MRLYLLSETGNFYKANLHCHSTISDGFLTPQEIKQRYKEQGYSVVAYTDHNIMVPHQELRDETFLPLNGFEGDFNETAETIDPHLGTIRCTHLCFISPQEHNPQQLCWHRTEYLFHGNNKENAKLVNFDPNEPDYVRWYDPESINDYIAHFKKAGFFVVYNHPTWSLENYREYSQYVGMDAMEVCNYSCFAGGYDEDNSHCYDDLLRQGKRIGCIGADDNHNHAPEGSARWDSFGAWTWIKAESLTYDAVFSALKQGNYYASCGPEIYELYYEEGKITVRCSSARRITLHTGCRRADVRLNPDGTLLTEATFSVQPNDNYVRIKITDEHGYAAYTRAYFLDELSDKI